MLNRSYIFKVTALLILVFLGFSVLFPETIEAQCRMCAASAESNLRNGGTEGKGLNKGILYLLATPYLLVFSIAFLYWKNRRKAIQEQENLLIRELLT